MNKNKAYFAPVPNRAVTDDRLRLIHYRVLALIAAHDRFGINGMGCTLSTRGIGERLKQKQGNVSIACRDLVNWGYLMPVRNPKHSQMRMLSVIYEDEDKDAFKARPATDMLEGIGSPPHTDMLEGIGDTANQALTAYTEESSLRYSAQSGENIPPQAVPKVGVETHDETRFSDDEAAEDFTLRDETAMAVWGPLRGKSSAP